MNTTIRISPTGLSNYQSQQEITTLEGIVKTEDLHCFEGYLV